MDKKTFLKAFWKNPRQTGSVIQSSPFLVRQMVRPVDFRKAKIIVEFGAGTGVVTEKILKNMSPDATLLCFEVNKDLCRKLRNRLRDPRLRVISDGAEKLERYLKRNKPEAVDYVISGLPLVVLPKEIGEGVLVQINKHLKKGGKFIQFQYSLTSRKRFKRTFSKMEIYFTLLNIPPAFVYVCTK